jgi:hypothetical protein
MVRCICSSFEFGTYGPDGSAESYEATTTECGQSTWGLFAQGHDAKLVGFLVRAELAGMEIRRQGVSFRDAEHAAGSISAALAAKARKMAIGLRLKAAIKEAKKATKKAKKAEAVAAPEPVVELAPIEARIKVGRWEYDAQIDRETGAATYTSKNGVDWTKQQGEYTVL